MIVNHNDLFSGLFIIILLVSFLIIRYAVLISRYKKTSYYQITHIPYLTMKHDKGRFGEYEIYRRLRHFEKSGAKFLFNLYLPKGNNETTEIDVLMIHQAGIFVFESKNDSGWIFGDENQKYWTQTLPQGKGKKALKEHFPNPVWQNKLHVASLNQVLRDQNIDYISLIIFSNRCELKNIQLYNNDSIVIHRRDILSEINRYLGNSKLDKNEINKLYHVLYPYTQISNEIKRQHIETINKNNDRREHRTTDTGKKTVRHFAADDNNNQSMICPKCGGSLILRTAKRGRNAGNQFYGCSNYPTCRYIKNI